MKITIPEIEETKNSDIYLRTPDWVKKAILNYMAKTGYELYLLKENDAVVTFNESGASITVTKKTAIKESNPVNLSSFWSWLKCSVLRVAG